MKQTMKLNENKLKQIIKESVKSVLNEEQSAYEDYNKEIFKNIRYHKDEAGFHLNGMIEEYQKIEGNDAYKNSQIAMVREALKTLSMAHCI